MAQKDVLGRRGEQLAADHLRSTGYRIIERNWRCSGGEIDIIAEMDGAVAIVEVKTRSGSGFGHPLEAITAAKLARLRRLALRWRAESRGTGPLRIDAVAVLVSPGGSVSIEHLTGVDA